MIAIKLKFIIYCSVQCPQGTFHNITVNKCQSCPFGYYNDDFGQITCKSCPLHHSTRKLHSKHLKDCKGTKLHMNCIISNFQIIFVEECPPGTRARRKTIKRRKYLIERTTLKPHCHSCPYGTYQPDYGQINCIKCPNGFNTTITAATSLSQCQPSIKTPCSSNNCKHGKCIPENDYYYSCECSSSSYIGSYCEIQINGCNSNPCLNNATCLVNIENFDYQCVCPDGFTGRFCENTMEKCDLPCKNFGICVQEDEQYFCLCRDGFEGEFCEKQITKVCDGGDLCENRGKCIEDDGNSFYCICVDGYIGKRCNVLPCDYQPCKGTDSICLNLQVENATKESYRLILLKNKLMISNFLIKLHF